MDFSGKTTVITGGATGIGFALAKELGKRGSKIILFEPRETQLQEAKQLLANDGIESKYFVGDVTKREDVEAVADFAWSENGRADAIINNAGIGGPMQKVIDFDMAEARKLFDVNYWGMWNGIQVFGKRFLTDGKPSAIYSVASENALFNVYPSGGGAYVSSKHAIFGLMDMLRKEVPDHIETGCIIPGWVATEMTRLKGMDADQYAKTIVPQMEAGEYYLVSHSYNAVRLDERYDEVKAAFAQYAPRYEGDDEYDVISAFAKARAAKQKT